METINKPQLEPVTIGKELKVLYVSGASGAFMPAHSVSSEAVIVVKQGRAVLHMDNAHSILRRDDVFVIPANNSHTLRVEEDFEAIVTMSVNSTIEFEEQ